MTTITTPRLPLIAALDRAAEVSPGKSPAPVLKCVLLEADGKAMRYAATNLQMSVSGTLTAAGKASFAVDPRELRTACQSLAGDNVKLEIKGAAVHVSGEGRRRFKVPVLGADEFPRLETMPSGGLELPAGFRDHLARVAYAARKDGGFDQPELRCVRVRLGGGSASYAATDGRRMAFLAMAAEGEAELLIPGTALRSLLTTDGPITYADSGAEMFFASGSSVLGVRKIGAQFPAVENALSMLPQQSLTVDAQVFAEALAAIGRVGESVALNISTSEIAIEAESGGSDASDVIPAECSAPCTTGHNASFLVEALKGIEGTITIGYGDELDPLYIKHEGYTAIAMPIRLEVMKQAKAAE